MNLYNQIYGFFTILKNILLCTAVVVARNSKIKDDPPDINIDLEFDTFTPLKKNINPEPTQ